MGNINDLFFAGLIVVMIGFMVWVINAVRVSLKSSKIVYSDSHTSYVSPVVKTVDQKKDANKFADNIKKTNNNTMLSLANSELRGITDPEQKEVARRALEEISKNMEKS
jgi:hypothetical protein